MSIEMPDEHGKLSTIRPAILETTDGGQKKMLSLGGQTYNKKTFKMFGRTEGLIFLIKLGAEDHIWPASKLGCFWLTSYFAQSEQNVQLN